MNIVLLSLPRIIIVICPPAIRTHDMSRRTTVPEQPTNPGSVGRCIIYGCGAGLLGVTA